MAKETGTLDLKALKIGHGDASTKATNYIEATASDGIKVHNAGDSNTYVQIVSGAINFVRSGVNAMKLWLDGAVSKIRVGDENGKSLMINSSTGVAVMDGGDEIAGFGSTMHIGKVGYDSPHFSIDENGYVNVNGAYIDLTPEGVSNPLYYARIAPHYVKVINKTATTNTHAISLYASSDSERIGLWDEMNGCWVLYADYLDAPAGTYQRVTIPARLFLANGTQIWDNTSQVTHLLTPVNSSNKQAEFTFEPDGKIYRRTSTNGGTSWSSWALIAG